MVISTRAEKFTERENYTGVLCHRKRIRNQQTSYGISATLLRGPYKRNEYRKVILPLTVLRRFDCLLARTKQAVLEQYKTIKTKPQTVINSLLQKTTGYPFYNLSKLDFPKLLDDPNQLAQNLNSYISAFSPNVRNIMERFAFDQQLARMAEKNILYEVVKAFCDPRIDLSDKLCR